jgi:hypothetical protein
MSISYSLSKADPDGDASSVGTTPPKLAIATGEFDGGYVKLTVGDEDYDDNFATLAIQPITGPIAVPLPTLPNNVYIAAQLVGGTERSVVSLVLV